MRRFAPFSVVMVAKLYMIAAILEKTTPAQFSENIAGVATGKATDKQTVIAVMYGKTGATIAPALAVRWNGTAAEEAIAVPMAAKCASNGGGCHCSPPASP